MATEVGSAYVTLIPSARGFASKMQSELGGDIARAGDQGGADYSDKFSKRAGAGIKSKGKAIFGGIAKAGALAGVAAGVAVGKVLTGSIAEARDAQVITARTENVIRKMGDSANISAKGVANLAGALSNKTAVDDEAIQAGQNLLLTFGNVRNEVGKGNDIFNQTSALMVDMSAAMGTDMKSSALQLGKALNDPTKGVAALTRSGVSFTQQQKDQIKALQENGDLLGAQKIIMGEVEKQFGGAAAAMSTPADRAKVAWGNFQEEIGTALLPTIDKILNALADGLPKVMSFAKSLGKVIGPAISDAVRIGKQLFDVFSSNGGGGELSAFVDTFKRAFDDLRQIISGAVEIIVAVWQSGFGARMVESLKATFAIIRDVISGAMRIIKGVINVVMGLISGDWQRVWDGIKQILSGAWQIIKSIVTNGKTIMLNALANLAQLAVGIMKRLWDGIKRLAVIGVAALIGLVRRLPGLAMSALSKLPGLLGALFSRAFSTAKAAVANGAAAVLAAVRAIPGKLSALGGLFLSAGKAIIGKFVDGLKGAGGLVSDIAGNVWDAVRGMINDAIDKINDALSFEISIPGPNVDVNIADIPHLATGGRATSATLAVIGEGAEAESVLPDSVLHGLLERAHAAGAARGVRRDMSDRELRRLAELIGAQVYVGARDGIAERNRDASSRRRAG